MHIDCVEVSRPSQPTVGGAGVCVWVGGGGGGGGVMSSAVSLTNHTFTNQAYSSKRLASIVHFLSLESISPRFESLVEMRFYGPINTLESCRAGQLT